MSHLVRVLARPAAAAGFRLAGLSPIVVENEGESSARLALLLDDPGVGVILMEQGLYDAMPASARRAISARPLPLVVPFPPPAWAAPAEGPEAFIAELLRQAIGYRVKLG